MQQSDRVTREKGREPDRAASRTAPVRASVTSEGSTDNGVRPSRRAPRARGEGGVATAIAPPGRRRSRVPTRRPRAVSEGHSACTVPARRAAAAARARSRAAWPHRRRSIAGSAPRSRPASSSASSSARRRKSTAGGCRGRRARSPRARIPGYTSGHTGSGELHELRAQPVRPAAAAISATKASTRWDASPKRASTRACMRSSKAASGASSWSPRRLTRGLLGVRVQRPLRESPARNRRSCHSSASKGRVRSMRRSELPEHRIPPPRRDLREHREPRAHVLPALRVVRRQRRHRVRGRRLACLEARVEDRHGESEDGRVAADIGQTSETRERLERRVLHALRMTGRSSAGIGGRRRTTCRSGSAGAR